MGCSEVWSGTHLNGESKKLADRAISRILFGARPRFGLRSATIIPLGPVSQPDSSGLPEG